MSDSVQLHRWQPTRLPRPWDSPGKNTGVGCHFLLQCMKVKVKSLSRVRLFATPWTAAYQALPSTGFSRQEYRSGVPLPSPMEHSCPLLIYFVALQYCTTGKQAAKENKAQALSLEQILPLEYSSTPQTYYPTFIFCELNCSA